MDLTLFPALRAPYGDGARLLLVAPDGSARVLSRGFDSAADPEVSRDGTQVLFAGKRTPGENWDIYEMRLDGSHVRQITKSRGDCRSPGYQSTLFTLDSPEPWRQITFVGARPGAVNECGEGPLWNLYSCKPDGSEVRQLTFNLSSDVDPVMMPDGRLLFASWRRSTLEQGPFGKMGLFAVNIDGTDFARYAAERPVRVQHMPCVTAGGLVVFVEADRVPWDGAGRLALVRVRRPLHSYQAISEPPDGLFHSPSPLPDGRILVSRRPADGAGTHAVYRFDPGAGLLESLFDDPRYHDIQAEAVGVRPEPDGRSSMVDEREPHGKLYCLNVYTSDLQEPSRIPRGSAKRVRFLEGVPTGDLSKREGIPQLALRRMLGEVPVDADGSFSAEVPADAPIELQLLDADGVAMRTCGWLWAKPQESRGCIGCHEDGELTPENQFVSTLARPSEVLAPPPEKRRSIAFLRDVVPILARKCCACHGPDGSLPRLDAGLERSAAVDRTSESRTYQSLLGRYVHPGQARTSPLAWRLFGRSLSRPWDGRAVSEGEGDSPVFAARKTGQSPASKSLTPRLGQAPVCAAGPNSEGSLPKLTAEERRLLILWIDLGARWEETPSHEMRPGGG